MEATLTAMPQNMDRTSGPKWSVPDFNPGDRVSIWEIEEVDHTGTKCLYYVDVPEHLIDIGPTGGGYGDPAGFTSRTYARGYGVIVDVARSDMPVFVVQPDDPWFLED
ncbi:hypothetical protein [Phytoactinopolyspora halophila]|uniref:hypothetical protein n=1 Tax=Phytoactinopolyspora halophila TaxID=1981511 RepID=UPI000F4EC7E5|nr:hypothetical protein [Phytoactinopolyspora halophila]